jgi:hypothetical protein
VVETALLERDRSLRTFSFNGPKSYNALQIPYRDFLTPQVLFDAILSSSLRRIGARAFMSARLIVGPSNPQDPMAGQLADFSLSGFSALSRLRPIATSSLATPSARIFDFRYPMRRNADTTLSRVRDFAPSLLRYSQPSTLISPLFESRCDETPIFSYHASAISHLAT